MTRPSTRMFLGCVAGAVSILVFHQAALQIFYWLGLAPQAAFRMVRVPPFDMPSVVSLTFWGAVYGGIFGLLTPRMTRPVWLYGLLLGLCAMLVAWFVFLPLKGVPVAWGWQASPMLRSLAAYLAWGVGVGVLLPVLHPRGVGAPRPPWARSDLAA